MLTDPELMLAHPEHPRPPQPGVFYVGAKGPSWLPRATGPLLVSRPTLAGRRRPMPEAAGAWYLDSGAYTELHRHGAWTVTPAGYAAEVARWAQAGRMVACGVQDWLTTPAVLEATGGTVAAHQLRSTRSFVELRDLAPELPWVPTLQGWQPDDYLRHADQLASLGVDLAAEPVVGVGSVAQRQHTDTAAEVFARLHDQLGLTNLHAYGAKHQGLARWGWAVSSADSMAWSLDARRMGYACGRHPGDCRNCQWWAEHWGARVARLLAGARQLELGGVTAPE